MSILIFIYWLIFRNNNLYLLVFIRHHGTLIKPFHIDAKVFTMLSSIPFSLLELASVPVGSDIRSTLLDLRTYAKKADKLGFTRLWLAEHHNMEGVTSSATCVLIADIAQQTERIRVGSGGIMLPNHPPLIRSEERRVGK